MLCASQQHIAACWPFNTGFEPSATTQPDDAAPILGTALDDEGRQAHAPKHDDPRQPQQWQPQLDLLLDSDRDRVVIEMQYCALGLHIQGVQQLAHHTPPTSA